jgi:hypothetical protein
VIELTLQHMNASSANKQSRKPCGVRFSPIALQRFTVLPHLSGSLSELRRDDREEERHYGWAP